MHARLPAVLAALLVLSLLPSLGAHAQPGPPSGAITFPTDALTVADATQLTGRRLALPKPDCAVEKSACDTIELLNTLDGFDLDPRVTVQLDAAPQGDIAALFGEDVLWVEPVAGGDRIGLNRFVFDPATNRLVGQPAVQLRESTRYRAVYRGAGVEFTTLSATAGLAQMRRQLDDGSAYAGIAAAHRRISFDHGGVRAVFPAAAVVPEVGITRYDEVVPRAPLQQGLVPNAALLNAGTYAFGALTVPSWLDADSTIAPAPTGGAGPPVRGAERIGVTVILPNGPRPAAGWPVAIFGPGITRSKFDIFLVADANAARGIATVSFDPVGHAYGPRSEIGVRTLTSPEEIRFPSYGRGRDINSDGVISDSEGVQAPTAPHPKSAVALRDGLRQSAADVMAISRAIGLGVDVDGDGTADLDPDGISFYALSLGGIYGSLLMGVDPRIEVAALNVPGGPITDIARQAPGFRPRVTQALRDRIPGILNGGPARFTESMPLYLDPPVTDPAPGALVIQDNLADSNWINRPGSPEAFAPRITRDPLPDSVAKRVIYQFAWGDQTVPNPTSATIARAFGVWDHVTFYRHDQTPGGAAGQNPHGILADPTIVPGRSQAQLQAVEWMASDGTTLLHPGPPWETPISDREALERLNIPEDLFGEDVPAPGRALERHRGTNRLGTAAAISAATYDSADTVVMARADDYADALTGGPLAVHLEAPLLLSGSHRLADESRAEIARLGASDAVLLGGEAALSPQVAADLESAGLSVRRVSGSNRFATAAAIAGELPFSPEVFVTEGAHADPGRGWPDALSASAVASSLGQPILLVTRDQLPAATREALTQDVNATIVGGTAAVSAEVAAAVDDRALDVRRVSGANRYATSRAMADEGLRRGLAPSFTWLATGRAFPDGLVAGAAAGTDGGLLLLVDGERLDVSAASRAFLVDHSRAFDAVRMAGGPAAIGEPAAEEVRTILR